MNDDANNNPQPKIAKTGPYEVELEAGKPYFWCFCGQSANQPFCDTAHVESDFAPTPFTVDETKTYNLCGCKRTGTAPFCDTTHESLGG